MQRGYFSSWLLNKERQDGFEIAENKPTILFVEHDSIFCDNIATKKNMLSGERA